MNPSDPDHSLRQALHDLKYRLDSATRRHSAEIEIIREEIAALEKKLTKAPATEKPSSAMQQAKASAASAHIATPPPIPQQVKPTPAPEAPVSPPTPPEVEQRKESASETSRNASEPADKDSFELNFGKVWFVRIGVVILLTGFVFLGNYAYQNWVREMPNGARLAALFACAVALIEAGRRFAAKENLNRFGEVLFAGGMAFFYYCTFAAHHVGRLRVIESPVVAGTFLFAAAGGIAAISWIRKTRTTAGLGFVMAAYATMLQPIGWMSCVSNLILAGAGLFFMLKPGWAGPGWASMLGSYAAFFGWQLLGGAEQRGTSDEAAMLWFLPPLWIMFAIPSVVGRFRESLSDRARAWFSAANNCLFFLLFSIVWINQNEITDYWKVAAVYGPVLIALGVFGRRQESTVGGVNISQGIAITTLALVLKLEGHHLALVLAMESLALALASWRFRGRSEAFFALLAAFGSGVCILLNASDLATSDLIPPWSLGLVAAFIAASSLVTVRIERRGEAFTPFIRFSGLILFAIATGIFTYLSLYRLEERFALLSVSLLAGLLPFASVKFDTKRLQPEIIWSGLWFVAISVWLGFQTEALWSLGIATAISISACAFWHREEKKESGNLWDFKPLLAWAHAVALPLLALAIASELRPNDESIYLSANIGAFILFILALCLGCKRLAVSSSSLALLSFSFSFTTLGVTKSLGSAELFISAALAMAASLALAFPWSKQRLGGRPFDLISQFIYRIAAFVVYCAAWHKKSPDTWSDFLAITAILLTLISVFGKRKLLEEVLGLVCLSIVIWLVATLTSPWTLSPAEDSWRGVFVIVALILMLLSHRLHTRRFASGKWTKTSVTLLAGLTAGVTMIWASQMLIWRFGWKPTAVLWTLLGFSYVVMGLWQRIHILRISGFILLLLSLVKLFAVDVWDFSTFMRVVSFIVLGGALILLGLFYNKFAITIKNLLEDENPS
ncbi:MAG: DUF2339 domain-containing protein [Akkermansiaceae bacterium]